MSLRKVLLQNYLFPNKKNTPKNDLAELGAAGTRVHSDKVQFQASGGRCGNDRQAILPILELV